MACQKNIGYFIGMSFKDNLKKHHLKLLKMMDGRAGWILEKNSAALINKSEKK